VSEEVKDQPDAEPAPLVQPEKAPEPDYYAQLLRLKAEFENYRKRVDREKPEWVKLGRRKSRPSSCPCSICCSTRTRK